VAAFLVRIFFLTVILTIVCCNYYACLLDVKRIEKTRHCNVPFFIPVSYAIAALTEVALLLYTIEWIF